MAESDNITVAIIVPCRNEEKFIAQVLDDILRQDYDKKLVEVYVADGMSTDKTVHIIEDYTSRNSNIHYIQNRHQTAPHALNLGITASKSDVVIRMDAHARYPANYASSLIHNLIKLQADNVGGVWRTNPGADTAMAKAIAIGSSHPIGIGNAYYKTGTSEVKQVDTVPFGCYRRSVFESIGLFDTELTRNQDDEFNGRLIKNGGSIYLIPTVIIDYYARPYLNKLALTYYQYGYYKPLVNKKLGKPATLRQLAPVGMVSAFIFFILLALMWSHGIETLIIYTCVYLVAIIAGALQAALINKKIVLAPCIALVFFTLHFSYGWGYLKGIIDFILLRKKVRTLSASR